MDMHVGTSTAATKGNVSRSYSSLQVSILTANVIYVLLVQGLVVVIIFVFAAGLA